jgi:murein DD-endopeptidase MepM/ murein hydrolase activator NlpD
MLRTAFLTTALAAVLASPAHALDIRVDPAPIFVYDAAPDRGIVDVVIHNILVVNNERRAREIRGLRVELLAGGEVVSVVRTPAATIAKRAAQVSQYDEAGLLKLLDFQVHLSRLMKEGEKLSADARLEPKEAYLNMSLYAAASAAPDTARIIVEGARGDIGATEVPVSRRTSSVTYRSPVDGRWTVVSSADVGHHHRWVVSSEYALDIVKFGPESRSHSGDGTRLTDHPTFAQPILAAADGVVVAARGDRIDNEGMLRKPGMSYKEYEALVAEAQQATLFSEGFEGAAGNYVLIRHDGGEHSLYAHLKQASVIVKPGDVVKSGQMIGEAGSSGNSTEPHLHFQVIDGADFNTARGLPVSFEGLVEDWFAIGPRHLRAGDIIEQE